MTEIKKNIPNYVNNIENIKPSSSSKNEGNNRTGEISDEHTYIADTGVLGRSQVDGLKGSGITRCVNETVAMAKNKPELMNCGDEVFETAYKRFLDSGFTKEEAYTNALLTEESFYELAGQ